MQGKNQVENNFSRKVFFISLGKVTSMFLACFLCLLQGIGLMMYFGNATAIVLMEVLRFFSQINANPTIQQIVVTFLVNIDLPRLIVHYCFSKGPGYSLARAYVTTGNACVHEPLTPLNFYRPFSDKQKKFKTLPDFHPSLKFIKKSCITYC